MYELTKLEYTRGKAGFWDLLPKKISMVTGNAPDAGFFVNDKRTTYTRFMRLKKMFEKRGVIVPRIYKIRIIEEY